MCMSTGTGETRKSPGSLAAHTATRGAYSIITSTTRGGAKQLATEWLWKTGPKESVGKQKFT